jgi:hypothetical protein
MRGDHARRWCGRREEEDRGWLENVDCEEGDVM